MTSLTLCFLLLKCQMITYVSKFASLVRSRDIFYFVTKTTLYNYADDNTVSYSDKDLEILKETLISECLNY